jgi:moderate conductance mechanosensitive channel
MLLADVLPMDLRRWLRGDGLEIVLLVIGSILLTRAVRWAGERVMRLIDEQARTAADGDLLVSSEQAKHRHALAQVLSRTAILVIYAAVALAVLQRLNVPLVTLVAPATVLGVALGFGSQRLTQDLLAGVFLITERQYGFGDVVRISAPGSTTGVSGTVEELTLRVTKLRTQDGELLIVPNGEIRQVTNLSREWARAVVDVPVPAGTSIPRVTVILQGVVDAAFADERLRPLLLDAPSVMGVESLDIDSVRLRLVARTLPGKQFEVGRQLRARIAVAFHDEGIGPIAPVAAPPG